MSVKGMRDIKTHGILSREEKLLGVKGKINRIDMGAWDGSVARNIFDKKSAKQFKVCPAKIAPFLFYRVGELTEKLFSILENDIEEMMHFATEDLPGAKEELNRLRQKLSKIKG